MLENPTKLHSEFSQFPLLILLWRNNGLNWFSERQLMTPLTTKTAINMKK